MIQENEIIMLILGMVVFIFILVNYPRLQRIPESKIFVAAFFVVLMGWVLTVLEGFLWNEFLNFLEHLCYATNSALIAFWCWKVFGGGRKAD